MSEQTIQSQDIQIAGVFQSFYVVPDYQREYVWGSDQVEQLLSDILGELAGTDPVNAPEYFIGSIVVCPGQGGVLELIDGQQRMTTLFLALCAIRARFGELETPPPGALSAQIAATSTDASGEDTYRYRMDLQYEDSGDVLVRIATGDTVGLESRTRSIGNILNAYETTLAFLRREFTEDKARLRAYYGYLTNKVKLIRIQTEDVAKALKIFETINDRGVGLDAMDLLKNLLFMKSNRQQFESLKNTWKRMQDTIYEMGEKPLRFLRYYVLSRFDVEILREDEIYTWFARNDAVCRYGTAPLEFADELLEAATAYSRFLKGYGRDDRKNPYLENLQLLGGQVARQHLILLLAGRHLPEALFSRLAAEVEQLFFVYVITRESTRDFERNFARWASEVRSIQSEADLDAFVARTITPGKAQLAARMDDALRRLYVGSLQQYRLRYILAKLTQFIELQAYGETDGTRSLGRYTAIAYEIEHIHPQKPSQEAALEFGPSSDPDVANRLGNLVLVEKSINASLGNQAYSAKRPIYRQSQLLLTRALAEIPAVGANTKIDTAVRTLQPFETWNESAIDRRQEMIRALARRVWNVPDKQGSEAKQ